MKRLHISPDPVLNPIIGVDEVGYGCIAGPLIVTAVMVTEELQCLLRGKDSKTYGKDITRMIRDVVQKAVPYCACWIYIDPITLCKIGYVEGLRRAFYEAVESLRSIARPRTPIAVIDGNKDFGIRRSQAKVKADATVPVVAYASCLGKIAQVGEMMKTHAKYPQYGFDQHHGYGTAMHVQKIVEFGMIPSVHRIPVVHKMLHAKGIVAKTKGKQ
jgi:ribonuclease HII